VGCLAFSPNGWILASGDFSQTVYLWDIDKQEQLRTLPGHYGELCALSFNGTGKYLAAVSRRGTDQGWEGDLKVWEVATGRQTRAIPSHTWWEADVAFHPRQPWIATTGKEHTLQMFHAETGAQLLNLPTYGYLCNTMAFSPDGTRLLVQLAGTAKLIDPTPEEMPFGNNLRRESAAPEPLAPEPIGVEPVPPQSVSPEPIPPVAPPVETSPEQTTFSGPEGLPPPVAYWSFDDPEQLGRDLAPEPVNGESVGSVMAAPGIVGMAASLPGGTAGIRCPDAPRFRTPGPFTLCCWEKWGGNEETKNSRMLGQWTPNDGAWQVWRQDRQWGYSITVDVGASAPVTIGAGTPVSGSDWHHVAVRFDGVRVALFLDGTPAKQSDLSRHNATRQARGAGSPPPESIVRVPVDAQFWIGLGYPGLIDEVRLYDMALTDEQIARIHAWRPE
jgi:hypothetical protein